MNSADANEMAVKPHTKRLGRELAMQFLFSCEIQNEVPGAEKFDAFFEAVRLEYQLKDNRLARKSSEYATALYTLVTLHREEIDRLLSERCENWDWDRISAVERNIMRVAVAEMMYMDDIPPVVSIDEAVGIARDFSGAAGGNFINGVLNSVKDDLE